ncbi:Methyltransferase ustM [Beauveria bassiana]|nr:Methyltransferase ustM [Beauveria bassiana]
MTSISQTFQIYTSSTLNPSTYAPITASMDHYSSMEALLPCYLHRPKDRERVVVPQFEHRLNLCRAWKIPTGARILDIGCGQGESTLILADAVGPDGHVTGVDTAPADYGGPVTVGQAQSFILKSPYASRLTFERAEVIEVLQRVNDKTFDKIQVQSPAQNASTTEENAVNHLPPSPGPEPIFDGAVFLHSLWYARSREIVASLFTMLANARIPRIYIAEWMCQANKVAQEPHYLAARAQMLLHSYKAVEDKSPRLDEQNIRAALPPDELFRIATKHGWKLANRGEVSMPDGYMEGHWEAQFVSSSAFTSAMERETMTEEQAKELRTYAELVKGASEAVRKSGKMVESMNVAWAVLELDS